MPQVKLLYCSIAKLLNSNSAISERKRATTIQQSNNVFPGFTLIELLVVLGILSLTVSSTLLFLTSVLRGSNKGNVIAEVKQNGQVVLESVERQIRNAVDAQKVKDVNGNDVINTIKLIRQDQEPFYLKCFSQGATYNGYIGTVVSSTTDPAGPSDGSYIALTNKSDTISGVNIDCYSDPTCLLDVIPASSGITSPPIVSICFYATQGIDAPSRQDFQVKDPNNPNSKGIKFQTTISLRRY